MTADGCTCPPPPAEPESAGRKPPGRPVSSGFTWHGPGCPIYEAAQWTPEHRRHIDAVVENNRQARNRAMVAAQFYIVGGGP